MQTNCGRVTRPETKFRANIVRKRARGQLGSWCRDVKIFQHCRAQTSLCGTADLVGGHFSASWKVKERGSG